VKAVDLPPNISRKAAELLFLGCDVYATDYDWDTGTWNIPSERMPAALRPKMVSLAKGELSCTRCEKTKSVSEFHKRPDKYSGGRGYAYHCKDCIKESKVG
jgi:hypothetical protein